MNYTEIAQKSINYIEDNLKEKLYLEDLSREFSISQAHFNRIFKFLTGVSLKKYILDRKLESSLQPLKESRESIINIAMDLGFDYPEVFSRAFKKKFAISPINYRKSDSVINKPNIIEVIIDSSFDKKDYLEELVCIIQIH